MASPVERGLTVDYLDTLPDDGNRYELIDGDLYVTPTPIPRHQLAASRLVAALTWYADTHGGYAIAGPGVYYSDRDYVEPDVTYFGPGRLVDLDKRVEITPDLIAEVSSPSTRLYDLGVKLRLYEQRGVSEYWFVDLKTQAVMVHRLDSDGHYGEPVIAGRGDEIRPPHLDGLTVAVGEILRLPQAGGPRRG